MPEIPTISESGLNGFELGSWSAMMLPIADKLDRAGFEIIDLMSGVQFDVAITLARGR